MSPRVQRAPRARRADRACAGRSAATSNRKGFTSCRSRTASPTFYPAQRADQAVHRRRARLGERYLLRAEAYRKSLHRLRPRYENLFDPLAILPELEPDRARVAPDEATARGLELSVAYAEPDGLRWWASYVRARATDVVDGETVPRSWDQRDAAQLGVGHDSGRWDFGAVLGYHSGWPTTGLTLEESPAGETTAVIGRRNALRARRLREPRFAREPPRAAARRRARRVRRDVERDESRQPVLRRLRSRGGRERRVPRAGDGHLAAAARDVRRPLAVLIRRDQFSRCASSKATDNRRCGGRSCCARISADAAVSRRRAIAMARRDCGAGSALRARVPRPRAARQGHAGQRHDRRRAYRPFRVQRRVAPRRRARQRDVRLRDAEPRARHSGHGRRRRHQRVAAASACSSSGASTASGAGIGTGSRVSATPTSTPVSNVAGQRADGGTFDIATTADDELHVFAGGGVHREIGSRWLLDTTLTIEHHDTHYELVDIGVGRARHDRLADGLRHRHRRELPVLAAATPRARCAAARRGSGPSARRASRRGRAARRGCAGAAAPGSARAGSAGRSRRT